MPSMPAARTFCPPCHPLLSRPAGRPHLLGNLLHQGGLAGARLSHQQHRLAQRGGGGHALHVAQGVGGGGKARAALRAAGQGEGTIQHGGITGLHRVR